LTAKALVIVPERLATPIAQAAPATVAQVEVLPEPSYIGVCRVKRGDLLMVREYKIVREWKTDHYLIEEPVVGGTFSRHISEIKIIQTISLQAVA